MGGQGSGRLPSVETLIKRAAPQVVPLAPDVALPNYSGDHSAGTVRTAPSEDLDIVNKEYVDAISINTGIDLYGYDTASDIGGYKQLKLTPSSAAKASGVVEIPGQATAHAAGARITEATCDCVEEINTLTAGVYNFHVHMKAENINRLKVYVQFYVRAAGGTETLIGTSNTSGYIGTTETGYDLHSTVTTEYPLTAGDRIVGKAFASNSSNVATDLTVYVEGDTATRISIRALTQPSTTLWEVDGTETQLKTADEIDMQTKKIINMVDPTANQEAATKKYVDDNVGAGDVTAGANLTDETLVQGDGGAKGVKTSTATVAHITANTALTAKNETDIVSVSGSLAVDIANLVDVSGSLAVDVANLVDVSGSLATDVANLASLSGSVADNTTAIGLNTTHRGDATGADHSDIVTAVGLNTAKDTNVTTNITVVEAPTNVDIQSSDGSNDTIAAADVTNAGVMTTTMYDEHVVNTAHALDNTQAHTDYLLNSAADIGVGLSLTGDLTASGSAAVHNILFDTAETPPAASGFPIGSIYVQYTA